MRLQFDHGTLVLAEAPDIDLGFLPGVMWDRRVALWRAPAFRHAEIVEALTHRRLPFRDETRSNCLRHDPRWPPIDLRTYQDAALLAWELAGRRGIVALPTGSGKTRLAIAAIAKARVATLCLVPTRALLQQWHAELRALSPESIGCLGDGERDVRALTVATFESAYRHMPELGAKFELVVIDEVHHFGAGVRDEALEMSIAPWRLGLTATPPADDALARLDSLVGAIVFQLGVDDLRGSYLADFDLVILRLPLDRDERRVYESEYRAFSSVFKSFTRLNPGAAWQDFTRVAGASVEGRAALAAWRKSRKLLGMTRAKARAIGEILDRHREAKIIVFTADNDAAYAVAREQLVMPITCDISRSERAEALDAFRSGELRSLVSSRVLNEGIDVPDADVAIIAGGTHGEREHVQRIGRLLRPKPGKRAIVYELVCSGTREVDQSRQRRKALAPRDATHP
jgi:superfamily II DNA or RNA helicase